MCTGGGGSSGRRLRSAGGRSVQRAGATQSVQSVFQGGRYRLRDGTRQQTYTNYDAPGGVEREETRTVANYRTVSFGKGQKELDRFNALRHQQFEKTAATEVKFPNRMSGNKRLRIMRNANRGRAGAKAKIARYTRDRSAADRYKEVDTSLLIKASRGPSHKNEVKRNAQQRVKTVDNAQLLKKARKARGANTSEAGYRSRRKSAAQATSGLRIGGSGVNVPGGGGV